MNYQISHDCETENACCRQNTIFLNMWPEIKRGMRWYVKESHDSYSWNRRQCPNRCMYISEFEFYLKPILKNKGIYLSKLVALVYILDLQTQRLVTNINYSCLATFFYYFTNLSLFCRKMYPPLFLENKQNSNPNPLCNVCEIQLW